MRKDERGETGREGWGWGKWKGSRGGMPEEPIGGGIEKRKMMGVVSGVGGG